MDLYSTNDRSHRVTMKEGVLRGLAPDDGLYMPLRIPRMPDDFFRRAPRLAFREVAFEVSCQLFRGDVDECMLHDIVDQAYDFDAPLRRLDDRLYVVELFHGPTLAFKDFAARFMARLMGHYIRDAGRELLILVATSGDTGSAVAEGFSPIPGIRVCILFPSGKVSRLQEMQLTTVGGNVEAVEVDGTFDDCQKLVKTAFLDTDLRSRLLMSSANSINIARLLPQTFYHFFAWAQIASSGADVAISVPSGNFGNLTAGLIARRMGLPVRAYVAATNANRAVPAYLEAGTFCPRTTIATLSSAMDVGNPSNFARVLDLYDGDHSRIAGDVKGFSFDDDQTRGAIRELYRRYGYSADPHTAVGYLGIKAYGECCENPVDGIFFATAHAAKFPEIVEPEIGERLEMPERLRKVLGREKRSVKMSNDYEGLRALLLRSRGGG